MSGFEQKIKIIKTFLVAKYIDCYVSGRYRSRKKYRNATLYRNSTFSARAHRGGRHRQVAAPSARRRPLSSCLITVSENILLLWKVFKLYAFASIKLFYLS